MKAFDFNQVRPTDAMVIVASVQLGIGLITLPRIITEAVQTSDGWISIMVGGSFTILMGWIIGIVIKRNPNENIFEMTSRLLGGWTARLLAVLYAVTMTLNFALIIRLIGVLAKTYFFERTPMEVIVLAFTLVVIYCAAGSRIAMLRLNLLFLPLILCSIGIIHMFNLGHLDLDNLKPMFTASWSAIGNGSLKSLLSYNAFFVILFYGNLLQRSDKLPRMIAGGMSIVLIVYLLVFLFTVGVLGLHTTMNVLYPTIEMAKEAEVPGGFFERLQSVFLPCGSWPSSPPPSSRWICPF